MWPFIRAAQEGGGVNQRVAGPLNPGKAPDQSVEEEEEEEEGSEQANTRHEVTDFCR